LQQILTIWSTFTPARRIVVVLATLAMFTAVLGVSRLAIQPTMTLLYAGLEPGTAGDVVAALEQQGVRYEVRSGAIFVEGGKRDALRLTLAADGLPANSGQGYELLDNLSGFGTTSQMFDAAYWRAKEGELARTITAGSRIKSARVHISNPSSNPFQRDLKPTASVTVTTTAGALASTQARALKFLIASAVAGLAPEDVSIIDGRSGVVVSDDETAQGMLGGNDHAAELRSNIQRLLEARVGVGKAVVEVNVETVTEREAITQRTFDPENRVAISSETESRSTKSNGTQGGSVSVASNLPSGAGANSGENKSSSENSESRERFNYEVSETTREVVRSPGAIKRISVAVLLDGIRVVDATTNTETWQPRPDAEIEALRELVSSAVGFDAERGDTIALKSMEFEKVATDDTVVDAPLFRGLNLDVMSLIQLSVLALVSLALGLFVVRPILSSGRVASTTAALAAPDRASAAATRSVAAQRLDRSANALGTDGPQSMALTGEIDDGTSPLPQMAVVSGEAARSRNRQSQAGSEPEHEQDPVARLRQLIEDRREDSVEILRSWMEDHEEKA